MSNIKATKPLKDQYTDHSLTHDQLMHLRRVAAGEEIPLAADVRALLTAYEAAIGREALRKEGDACP